MRGGNPFRLCLRLGINFQLSAERKYSEDNIRDHTTEQIFVSGRIQNGRVQNDDVHAKRFGKIFPLGTDSRVIAAKAINAFNDQDITITQNAISQRHVVYSLKTTAALLVHIDITLFNAVLEQFKDLTILILLSCGYTSISKFLIAHGFTPSTGTYP